MISQAVVLYEGSVSVALLKLNEFGTSQAPDENSPENAVWTAMNSKEEKLDTNIRK